MRLKKISPPGGSATIHAKLDFILYSKNLEGEYFKDFKSGFFY